MAELIWTVGDVIRKLRDGREWKQEALAEKAHVSLATVVRVEKGEETKTKTIAQIATAFELSVTELYLLIPNMKQLPTRVIRLAERIAKSSPEDIAIHEGMLGDADYYKKPEPVERQKVTAEETSKPVKKRRAK